jgi:hypothetical protein
VSSVSRRRPHPQAPYVRTSACDPRDVLPDARDGLTRIERIVLHTLHETQRERGGRDVPTAMLYGRVVEKVDISVEELQRVLQRLIGVR